MTQSNFGTIDPYVVDGVQLAGMLNNWRDAVHSLHRGVARPSYVVPGMMWIDDAGGATNWIVKVNRAAGADISLFTLNSSTGAIAIIDGMAATTQTSTNNTTLLATTAFVQAAITAAVTTATSALIPPGTVVDMAGALTVAPTGWVLAMQGTIGNASSGATIRANADTVNLFTHLWTLNNVEAPVLPGGRGGSAAADYAANKTIGGLDLRGRVRATWDSLGGTAASVLAGFARNGMAGGASTHALSIAELAAHAHGVSDPQHDHTASGAGSVGNNLFNGTDRAVGTADGVNTGFYQSVAVTVNGNATGISIQNTGSGTAHNNVQPTRNVTTIIKL